MVMSVIFLHSPNASNANSVRVEGSVTELSLLMKNASSPITNVPSGTVYSVPLAAGYCTNMVLSLLKSTPSTELYSEFASSTVIDVIAVQPESAFFPRACTDAGKWIAVNCVQYNKAPASNDVIFSGNVIDFTVLFAKAFPLILVSPVK